jgi:hypothetical protein
MPSVLIPSLLIPSWAWVLIAAAAVAVLATVVWQATSGSDAPDETEQQRSQQDALAEPSGEAGPFGETAPVDDPAARGRSETDEQVAEPLAGPRRDAALEQGDLEAGSAARAQPEAAASDSPAERRSLLPDDQSQRFSERWNEIQTRFVDEPRDSVAKADALVADVMQRLEASFSTERERLEAQWDGDDDVSTEDLRIALTRYRSFFDRLLSA